MIPVSEGMNIINSDEVLHTNYYSNFSSFGVLLILIFIPLVLLMSVKVSLWLLLFLYIPFLFLYGEYKDITEKVVITTKGIKYYSIFKKIDCEWKDIIKLEIISYWGVINNQKLTWIEYNFIT
jgi:hypothetical protein